MAGKITSLLAPSRIALHVHSTKRTAALNEVAHLLDGHPDVVNFAGFYEELLARDRLDTTCLGNAIALPHARTEHVKQIVLAVGRSNAGIPFDANGEIVKLFFVLGTPKSKPGDYLAVVSALCKLLRDSADRATFLAAETPEAFIAASPRSRKARVVVRPASRSQPTASSFCANFSRHSRLLWPSPSASTTVHPDDPLLHLQ